MTLRAGWLKRLAVVLCLSLRGGRVERERGEGEVLRCLFQLGNGDILYGESDIYHTWCFLSRRFQKNAFLLSPCPHPPVIISATWVILEASLNQLHYLIVEGMGRK